MYIYYLRTRKPNTIEVWFRCNKIQKKNSLCVRKRGVRKYIRVHVRYLRTLIYVFTIDVHGSKVNALRGHNQVHTPPLQFLPLTLGIMGVQLWPAETPLGSSQHSILLWGA